PWPLPTAREYIDLVLEYISHLPSTLVLERFVSQSPPEYVIAPLWGLKNYQFTNLVKEMKDKE
ncbi:MAG: TIGR01212 family radical SAM protein, partial [Bacteroidaceae bacterium]|nr:TIGR01212 family radical SAM protein [Bacteroidaceae bacterium]